MELLYNLALDYERKRQFNKAGAVYSHMAEFNIDYKDLRQRVKRSQNLEETLVLGRGSLAGVAQPGQRGRLVQKPMLGRYAVEKEIGKGAMGVVYLGRDPKINRVVAIKTIPLSDEFDEEDLADAKERFFREAETAGRLNHPNIVTIFDAGEEHDLAYIAMEFLKGDHLNRNTKPDNLLPPATVLDIIARTADALHYAHKQNVVHGTSNRPISCMIRKAVPSRSRTLVLPELPIQARPRPVSCWEHHRTCHRSSWAAKPVDGPLRPVQPGGYALSTADRSAAFSGRFDGYADVQDRQRSARPRWIRVRPDLPACLNDVIKQGS